MYVAWYFFQANFDYLGEFIDKNITVTVSGSDFDSSDSESQSNDSKSENKNTAIFHERSIHELKEFRTGKKWMTIHICSPKFILDVIGKYMYLVHDRSVQG